MHSKGVLAACFLPGILIWVCTVVGLFHFYVARSASTVGPDKSHPLDHSNLDLHCLLHLLDLYSTTIKHIN